MGLLTNLNVLFRSTASVGAFFRAAWALLPLAVQVLIIFSFAVILLIALINKI